MAWNTSALNSYDKYMFFVGIVGKTFLILQIYTIIRNQSSENVSFLSYLIYFLTSLSWLIFAVMNQNLVITVSSFVGIICSLTAMNTVVMYKQDKSDIF
jgi:uncharacterized protein with PQ loop repeat